MSTCFPVAVAATGAVATKGNYKIIAVSLTVGSDDASLILNDDPDSADGTELVKIEADYSVDESTRHYTFVPGISASNGVYATISGTDAYAKVYLSGK